MAYPGGAAFVPPEAAHWYEALPLAVAIAGDAASLPVLPEPEQVALPPAPELPPPPAPKRRRSRKASPPRVDTGALLGRIIAAERKAAKLANGTSAERRQAQAIRYQAERLKRQLEQARQHGYSPEECDQWLESRRETGQASAPEPHARQHPTAGGAPPLISSTPGHPASGST